MIGSALNRNRAAFGGVDDYALMCSPALPQSPNSSPRVAVAGVADVSAPVLSLIGRSRGTDTEQVHARPLSIAAAPTFPSHGDGGNRSHNRACIPKNTRL